jgi:hypothetical protein
MCELLFVDINAVPPFREKLEERLLALKQAHGN